MNVSLYQATAAMNAASRWQDVIAENLSAASVPGFKKRELSFDAVQAGMMTAGGPFSPAFLLPRPSPNVNLLQGELRRTGVPTDLAIDGPGFFEVQMPNGTKAYTRDGEFSINAQGQLTTKTGWPVMGETGPIQLDPALHEPLTISATGEVSQGGVLRGKLRILEFNYPHRLTPAGPGLFLVRDPQVLARPAVASTVRQEFLENSNTSPIAEMTSLIAAMRHFETAQRVVQIQDERMGRTISELAGTQ